MSQFTQYPKVQQEVRFPGLHLLKHNVSGQMEYFLNGKRIKFWSYDEDKGLVLNPIGKTFSDKLEEVAERILTKHKNES